MKAKRITSFFFMLGLIAFFLFLQASSAYSSDKFVHPDFNVVKSNATPTDTVTIRGKITDINDGQPLRVYISVSSSKNEQLGNTMSNWGGNYSIQVPYREGYILHVQGADERVQYGSDVIPTGHLDQYKYAIPSGDELVVDFSLPPAGAIWLQTYDLSGKYLFRQDVNNNNWTVGIYPLGTSPTLHPLQYINHQINTFWGWRNGSDKNHPVVLIPSEIPVELWIRFHVPEVGDTYIHLDNDGQGYIVKKGGVLRVNLLFDAARTEYRLFQDRLNQYLTKGYTFTDEITQWNTEAGHALEDAIRQFQEMKLDLGISNSYIVLSYVIKAREEITLQVAKQDIEKYRRKDVRIQIKDCNDTPITGLTVKFQQVAHDFIFGAGWPENYELPILKQAGFNGAIQEAWWGEVTSYGENYKYGDETFNPITQQGMNIIMHTGVWISPLTNPNWYFYPRVIEHMNPSEIADLAKEFSNKFTNHYRDRMVIYNAFNEPQNAFYTFHFTIDDVVNIAAASVAGAKQGALDVPTYINFYNTYLGDMEWYMNPYNETYPSPEEILQAIIKQNIPFDNIGLEFYSGVVPTIDFGIYNDTIEHYGQYGKSVFVSEISYGTDEDYPNLDESWYHGDWHEGHTDQTQAEWAIYAYTIAFSKPYVTGIVWVPGSDTNTSSSLFGYGLFNANGNPRPVVNTISDLIHSWTTSGSGITNEQGILTWRGFAGTYEITWLNPDNTQETAKIHVVEDSPNEFILQSSHYSQANVMPTQIGGVAEIEEQQKTTGYLILVLCIVVGVSVLVLMAIFFVRRRYK